MTEDELVELHSKITPFAEPYDIELVGDDGVVAMRDFRLMDVEHIIHELAHCTLFGIDIEQRDCTEKLKTVESSKPSYQQKMNEIEAFSVTMEVLRRLGAADEVVEGDFFASLAISAYGVETPDGIYGSPAYFNSGAPERWVENAVRTFQSSPRGEAAVHRLINLFEGGVT